MDIQKIKKLKIDWLGKCPKCCSSQLTVETKNGSETWLYDGDKVACDCGEAGEIDTDGQHAWVNWDEYEAQELSKPVEIDRDTARQKLAMMWRGESTEINGRTVIFNESGCFDVRQDFGSGHFSQSLKATLDYLFQQRQSL